MAQEFGMMYCDRCKEQVQATRSTPNHVLHFLLLLFTMGVWLPVWLLITLNAGTIGWRCVKCGSLDAAHRRSDKIVRALVYGVIGFVVLLPLVIGCNAMLFGR